MTWTQTFDVDAFKRGLREEWRVTAEAWSPYVGADGRVRLPNEAYWVAASTPT